MVPHPDTVAVSLPPFIRPQSHGAMMQRKTVWTPAKCLDTTVFLFGHCNVIPRESRDHIASYECYATVTPTVTVNYGNINVNVRLDQPRYRVATVFNIYETLSLQQRVDFVLGFVTSKTHTCDIRHSRGRV